MNHRISAGAIVEHQGRLLLVRCVKPDRYDFWVAPGGGVKDDETLEQAAVREVREETGLDVEISKLLYIEELLNPECRFVKFWFLATLAGGSIDIGHPEAILEHIVQAAWLAPDELSGKQIFPTVLTSQYWSDRDAGFPSVTRLPIRQMAFW